MNEETMVENVELDNAEAVDALPEAVVEETDDSSESLESLTGEEQADSAEPAQKDSPSASEPGWIKQRISKAVDKAVAQALAQQREEFERQMAPLREKALNDEAKELVRQGEFKSLDRAKEYLQLKQGLPVSNTQPAEQEQPRNNKGQFATKDDPVVSARIEILGHQADKIKASTGVDVIAEFESNKEIKQKVISGEMDFYDVAEAMKQQPKKRPPTPMRSPNGASGQSPNAIESMSDEQFARMEKRIKEGARYSLR